MRMKFITLAVAVVCTMAFADGNLVWKNSKSINDIQNDLNALRSRYTGNSDLDQLWNKASRIAAMNDQCSVIKLEEPLNDECGHFYKVELPQFEAAFQKISGELRIAAIEIQSDMRKQTNIIKACAEALDVFYASEAQLGKINGDDVKMKALNFQGTEYTAVYNFKISPNKETLGNLASLLSTWGKKCGSVADNVELFAQGVDIQNKVMAAKGSTAEARIVKSTYGGTYLQFYHRQASGGHYELGNKAFCNTKNKALFQYIDMGSEEIRNQLIVPYLSIPISENGRFVTVGGGTIPCQGSINLKATENFWGRWVWHDDNFSCSAAFNRGSKDYWNCINNKKRPK